MIVRMVSGFARFWWDFVIGDEWRIAAGVACVVVISLALVRAGLSGAVIAVAVALAVFSLAAGALLLEAARRKR